MSLLSKEEIEQNIIKLKGWKYNDNQIDKVYELKDFKTALGFINKIGEEAEKMDHHPDIFLHSYNKVKVTLSTHSEGGVTGNDFKLAEKIENLPTGQAGLA